MEEDEESNVHIDVWDQRHLRHKECWVGLECELLNMDGVVVVDGRLQVCETDEPMDEDVLGHDHVGVLTLKSYELLKFHVMTLDRHPLQFTKLKCGPLYPL